LIEEAASPFTSPELRPALPSKHNDEMPDKTYDVVAEKNLFPRARYEIGVGPKPKWMKKSSKNGKKSLKPKPAAKGRKSRKSRKALKAKARKSRKSRKGSKGSKKSKKSKSKFFDGKDPRKIVSAPHLQDIWDARHKNFVAGTDKLLNEVDDGILEHMVYDPIKDPNCKTGKAAKKL